MKILNMKEDTIDKLLETWQRERPDLDPWPSGIAARIFRLATHLRRHAETWLDPMGLSWETFEIITALRRNGAPYEMKPTALYRATFLTSGAMTNRLDRAHAAGLIVRMDDPEDRRGVVVRLTPAGLALANDAIERYYAESNQLMGHLRTKQRTDLANLLRELLMPMEDAATETVDTPQSSPRSTTPRKKRSVQS